MTEEIPFEIIHEGIIESTIPLSIEKINKLKKIFIFICEKQTNGCKSGNIE